MMDPPHVHFTPAREEDLPEMAVLAAGFQAQPEWASAYLGTEADGIEAEVAGIDDWPAVSVVAREATGISGWLIGEVDDEIGRVWWLGPFGDPRYFDTLHATARALVDPAITEEELAIDEGGEPLRRWAASHGFVEGEGSAILKADLPLDYPPGGAVRPIQQDDGPRIGALHERLFPNTHLTGRQLVEDGDSSHVRLVVCAGPKSVGYVAVERQPDGGGYIDFLGVHEDHRGKGYAKDLIVAGARSLEGLGCTEVHLSVRASNTAARTLYASLGFIESAVVVPLRKRFTIP